MRIITASTFGAAVIAVSSVIVAFPHAAGGSPTPVVVRVQGSHLVNGSHQSIRLLGVNRDGANYRCELGYSVFDGPSSSSSVAAMASWKINAVRIPLNEGCWLGLYTTSNDRFAHGRDPTPYEGSSYRNAIVSYVDLLHAHGIAVILSLQALDTPNGLKVPPMADAAHSPAFWRSVARTFKSDPGVLFDLYNEPNHISWQCWLSGCRVRTSRGDYQTSGMQSLVDAVRSTGATQPILIGGIRYANSETGWLHYTPQDPAHQLVASFHTYANTQCRTVACWNATVLSVSQSVPVVTGEMGEFDCNHGYIDKYMAWADAHNISYLGWTWNATSTRGWSCRRGPSLIRSYDGTPTRYGQGLKDHLAALARERTLPASLR